MTTDLSIIIPTYNRERMLSEALDSVLKQSMMPKEVIVVDDCSTDDTATLCRLLSKNFSEVGIRLLYERQDRNCGAQVARNVGLLMSSGEYVLFMDSDDILAENACRDLDVSFGQGCEFVWGDVLKTDENLNVLPNGRIGSDFSSAPDNIAGYHWHTMAAAYRRTALGRVGAWNESLSGSQDWEFQVRVKLAGLRGCYLDGPVIGFWRQHNDARVGATSFRKDYVRSVELACESILDCALDLERQSAELKNAIGRKLIIHMIEYRINDCNNDFYRLRRKITLLELDRITLIVAWVAPIVPTCVLKLLWSKVVA